MNKEEALKILKQHNEWRRGNEDVEMVDVKEFGLAIRALQYEDWQPIKTAPKDGTKILALLPQEEAYHGYRIGVAAYEEKEWYMVHDYEYYYGRCKNPTHWKPMPELPKKDKK